jgi:hypothetical protein
VDAVEEAYEIRKVPDDYAGTPIDYTRERVTSLLDNFAFAKDPDVSVSC